MSADPDTVAGITVALMLVPQSMAYAQLAGLPAYYGLYAAFLPPMIDALFGSSRQLATASGKASPSEKTSRHRILDISGVIR